MTPRAPSLNSTDVLCLENSCASVGIVSMVSGLAHVPTHSISSQIRATTPQGTGTKVAPTVVVVRVFGTKAPTVGVVKKNDGMTGRETDTMINRAQGTRMIDEATTGMATTTTATSELMGGATTIRAMTREILVAEVGAGLRVKTVMMMHGRLQDHTMTMEAIDHLPVRGVTIEATMTTERGVTRKRIAHCWMKKMILLRNSLWLMATRL
mmetsp:Transcript_40788/g.55531  ORF Transcript_40788/g.55531 Transcript_40788/m.55531 type:complete len:210 (+) Transcript_40788:770-1399(+)